MTVAAVLLLAAALVAAGGRPGSGRLHALDRRGRATGPDPPLRAPWIAVGAAAAGTLAATVAGIATGIVVAAVVGTVGAVAARLVAAGAGPAAEDGSDLAAGWDLLAVCLQAGLPVPVAVGAAAGALGGTAGAGLRRVAGLLELGADPAEAWITAAETPALTAFARAAGRSAGTGAALAQVARVEAQRIRAGLVDSAQARAQRAAVLITGPLGLCFLPAFLVLGIAPVVIGLASEALAQW